MRTHYVAGFLFNSGGSLVALIEKTKPQWQAGKLNAIGGHVEKDESADEAMLREFREEAGLEIKSWRYFCRLMDRRGAWTVHFFAEFSKLGVPLLPIDSNEGKISLYAVSELRRLNVIPNLRWLIPLALDPSQPFAAVLDNLPGEGG